TMDEERTMGIDIDPLTIISQGNEGITLPKFSINSIELSNATLSTSEIAQEQKINIFPNPSRGVFNIKIKNGQKAQYKIYSINGVTIQKGNFVSQKQVRLAHMQSGVYILQLESEQRISNHKIIVK
ncbi:MAG: T9SS type A sorting domain-containing protein, partial [Polaribacter sp.]